MKLKLRRTAKKSKYTMPNKERWLELSHLPNEEWRKIDGLEYYMVSNYGRVKSVDRISVYCNGIVSKRKGRILKQNVGTNGYLYFNASENGKSMTKYTHRCVALAFLPNIDESKDTVDHINNNKQDNRVCNLQWLSQHDNASKWSTGMNPYDKHLASNPKAKRVLCFENGVLLKIYPCAKLISLECGINYSNLRYHLQKDDCVIDKRKYRYEVTTKKNCETA